MNRHVAGICVFALAGLSLIVEPAAALDKGYQELRGPWQVIELVDNGRVILAPSGEIGTRVPPENVLALYDQARAGES